MRGSQVSFGTYRRVAAVSVVLGVVGTLAAGPAQADSGSGGSARWSPLGIAASAECTFPSKVVESKPWSLQRVMLDQLWQDGKWLGTGMKVAVIDTGVDDANPQLSGKVTDAGSSLRDKSNNNAVIPGTGKTDDVGHGTKVAGIIAARRVKETGFSGLAPEASILAYRQNDAKGNGDVGTLTDAIKAATAADVDVINISQDVRATDELGNFKDKDKLHDAIIEADRRGIVIVASAGNDGREGDTWPAAFDEVLAVGASDRNNERASFSQYGDFVDIAAPGVDMLSTVPGGGHCVDNGTSFSTPYVAGVATLLKQKYPGWTAKQIRVRLLQTAQRVERKNNRFVGWGVVDPVKALSSDAPPAEEPKEDEAKVLATTRLQAQPLGLAETQADRDARTATYALGVGGLLVGGLAGGSIVMRDRSRRRQD
ncbi:type VII secretion-associated serine protease mycosin [Kitasatospora sp. NPDC002040]|uniref:type VII secretion-associated serine protease mycosin n=1 Tax=Kitasatospora sp. NPDC002040 TaxID=3154661 RepID=UPI003330B71C